MLVGASVFTSPVCSSCVLVAHVSNPISIPSASDHPPPPRSCNVCFPCPSPAAGEPLAPPLSLDLTLDLPYERGLSWPPHVPWAPQQQPLLPQPWQSQRARPLSSLSQSCLCQFPDEGHAQPLFPLLLPSLRSCALRPLGHNPYAQWRRPSHLQPYSHPSQLWQPQKSQQS